MSHVLAVAALAFGVESPKRAQMGVPRASTPPHQTSSPESSQQRTGRGSTYSSHGVEPLLGPGRRCAGLGVKLQTAVRARLLLQAVRITGEDDSAKSSHIHHNGDEAQAVRQLEGVCWRWGRRVLW